MRFSSPVFPKIYPTQEEIIETPSPSLEGNAAYATSRFGSIREFAQTPLI